MPEEFDYIVIGVGGIGSAALYWLTRTAPNAKILGLEQFNLGHVRGGSQDVSRIIRRMYASKKMTDFAAQSYAPWREIEAESGLKLVHACGGLFWTTEDTGNIGLIEQIRDSMTGSGSAAQILSAAEIEARWPQISLGGKRGAGVLDPSAGLVDAAMANGAHQAAALQRGALILEHAKVLGLRKTDSGGMLVVSTKGSFACRAVVVTSGAWVNEVIADTGVHIPVKVSQENVTYFATPNIKDFTPDKYPVCIAIDKVFDFYSLPVYGIPGFKIGIDAAGNGTTGDTRTWVPDPKREQKLKEFVNMHYPKAIGRVIETKTCLYTMTYDRTFVVDSLGRHGFPDVIVCVGAGHAYKFAALLGKILADLAVKKNTKYDIDAFKLDRPAITDPNFKPVFTTATAKL